MRLRALGNPMSWRRPFDGSVDRERLRRRLLVFTGLWFLMGGLLAALGFGVVLRLTFAIVVVGGGTAGGLWLLRRYEARQRLRSGSPVDQVALPAPQGEARRSRLAATRAGLRETRSKMAAVASDRTRLVLARGRRSSSTAAAHLRARAAHVPRPAITLPSVPSTPEPVPVDPQQQARRLNEQGALLRREGNHELAAEQHRAALAIVRDLGDRRAEALTLNNLALALAHTGVPTALQHFEQSLVVLRELGDEEHEGQVIANLGFVHRREGRSDEAETLLNQALGKLPPGSSAYRHVEEQLRRAS